MPEKIQILSDHTALIRGQETTARVVLNFTKPTKVRGIHAVFHAAEKTTATYTTTTTDSKGRAKTETRTATQFVDIVKEQFLLHGAKRKGFFSRIGDSMATWVGGGSHVVLEGEHEFPLVLHVPDNAPASFKGNKCEVFYKVDIAVDLPIKIDWSKSQGFAVTPEKVEFKDTAPVHVVFPDESGRTFWDKTFGKDVKLNLAVDRDRVSVGEQALAMLTVETPEPLKVNKMEILLVGTESTVANGHTDSFAYSYPLGQIDSPNVISNDSAHEFELEIPEIEGPHSQTGTHYEVVWTIEVRLKIPWAKDPIIRAPITIAPAANAYN
ncbi:MAG: hypothetical protein AB8B55_02320 [Mariniblastus sp.]